MAQFKSPHRGGNVVHRLDVQALAGSRLRQRRLRGVSFPGAHAVVHAGAALGTAPAQAPVLHTASAAPAPVAAPRPAAEVEAQRQIDRLERRLRKVSALLDDRDEKIIMLARRGGGDGDDGVASIYREVQGVHGRGKDARQRKELMSKIFEANLNLRERIRPASSGAE